MFNYKAYGNYKVDESISLLRKLFNERGQDVLTNSVDFVSLIRDYIIYYPAENNALCDIFRNPQVGRKIFEKIHCSLGEQKKVVQQLQQELSHMYNSNMVSFVLCVVTQALQWKILDDSTTDVLTSEQEIVSLLSEIFSLSGYEILKSIHDFPVMIRDSLICCGFEKESIMLCEIYSKPSIGRRLYERLNASKTEQQSVALQIYQELISLGKSEKDALFVINSVILSLNWNALTPEIIASSSSHISVGKVDSNESPFDSKSLGVQFESLQGQVERINTNSKQHETEIERLKKQNTELQRQVVFAETVQKRQETEIVSIKKQNTMLQSQITETNIRVQRPTTINSQRVNHLLKPHNKSTSAFDLTLFDDADEEIMLARLKRPSDEER